MRLTYIMLVLYLCNVTSSIAKDFGVEGHVFKIDEENIIKVIEERLKQIDIEKINQQLKERTKSYIENPPAVLVISTAKVDKEFHYDPSYTLAQDIKDHLGNIIHKAGKTINPLEHIPLREDLIFINGDDKAQVQLALDEKNRKKGNAKIILVKGNPLKLQKKHKVWIYFDQAGYLTSKLGINEVPAIVTQEGIRLKVTIKGLKQ